MSGSRVVVIDHGWRKIERAARVLARREVRVGIRAGAASNEGVAIVDIAAIQEFGSESVPSRPFIRRTADMAQPDLSNFARRQVGSMLDGVYSAEVVLERLGSWYVQRMQATIHGGNAYFVPNAPSTIAQKKSSQVLIDNADMLRAIDFEVS